MSRAPRGRGCGILLLLLAIWMPHRAAAQEMDASALLGERVRLTIDDTTEPITGRVMEVSADSVWLDRSAGAPFVVALSEIRAWERSAGESSRAGKGFLVGGGIGLGTGVLGMAVLGEVVGQDSDPGPGGAVLAAGIGGFFLGALVGAALGSAVSGEDWVRVPVSPPGDAGGVSLRITPGRGGVGVGLAARVRW